MKKIVTIVIALFLLVGISDLNAQRAKWKEMEEFHTVMSNTFHPAEEGRLDPIKERSAEMLAKAKAWKKSDAPEGYDKKAIKSQLKELVKGSKELNKMVKSQAGDTNITEKLTKLHDIFHGIMDKARKSQDDRH